MGDGDSWYVVEKKDHQYRNMVVGAGGRSSLEEEEVPIYLFAWRLTKRFVPDIHLKSQASTLRSSLPAAAA